MMPMMFPFGGMAFAGLGAVLLAIVVAAILMAAWPAMSNRESAEEVLRQRYARGEIDADEYGRRLTTLRRSGSRS
jgi:putative membrane protein